MSGGTRPAAPWERKLEYSKRYPWRRVSGTTLQICHLPRFVLVLKGSLGDVMADAGKQGKSEKITAKTKKIGWFWPLGVVATSVAGVAVVALRGCWHRRMSWPVRMQNHSYQVCLECGVKRLFDEEKFCSYGPFRYDLTELIAWERAKQSESLSVPRVQPSTSEIIAPKIVAPKIVAS